MKIIGRKQLAITERKLCSFPNDTPDNVSLEKKTNNFFFYITIWESVQLPVLPSNIQTPGIYGFP